jgi:hypothetical protein
VHGCEILVNCRFRYLEVAKKKRSRKDLAREDRDEKYWARELRIRPISEKLLGYSSS